MAPDVFYNIHSHYILLQKPWPMSWQGGVAESVAQLLSFVQTLAACFAALSSWAYLVTIAIGILITFSLQVQGVGEYEPVWLRFWHFSALLMRFSAYFSNLGGTGTAICEQIWQHCGLAIGHVRFSLPLGPRPI